MDIGERDDVVPPGQGEVVPGNTANDGIFRTEALVAREGDGLGEVVISAPISFYVISLGAFLMGIMVLSFFYLATYTRRTNVSGQLVPREGLITIYPQQAGTVVEKRVSQGESVREGDVIYVVSSDRNSSSQGGTQATISSLVTARRDSLLKDMRESKELQEEEQAALSQKVKSLEAGMAGLNEAIDEAHRRVALAEEESSRYQGLLSHGGFVSREAAQQKLADLIEQQTRLAAAERDRLTANRELDTGKFELRSARMKEDKDVEQIQREIDSAEQEFAESEAKRDNLIKAPRSGILAVTIAEVGQTLDPGKPVASIVGDGATLQAYLYVTSNEIGFVKRGDSVLLRYRAYPYQKFGSFSGTVTSISLTPLSGQELTGFANFTPKSDEPLYRVTVTPERQEITVNGGTQRLQVGMLLDADMLQDTRRLYEWILEPLYALSDRLKSKSRSP